MSSKPAAFVFLLDNSATSINGDYMPTRLQAQVTSIERLFSHILDQNDRSKCAAITTSNTEFGIRTSFTRDMAKMSSSLNCVTAGGSMDLYRGIKTAVLSLSSLDNHIGHRRVFVYICSAHGLKHDQAEELKALMKKKNVQIDVFQIGPQEMEDPILKVLTSGNANSRCFIFKDPNLLLSDQILERLERTRQKSREPIRTI